MSTILAMHPGAVFFAGNNEVSWQMTAKGEMNNIMYMIMITIRVCRNIVINELNTF